MAVGEAVGVGAEEVVGVGEVVAVGETVGVGVGEVVGVAVIDPDPGQVWDKRIPELDPLIKARDPA